MWLELKQDLKAQSNGGSRAVRLKIALLNHNFHLVFFVRLGIACRKVPFLGRVLQHFIEYFIRVVYASDISCAASLAGGLNIMHGHDIVIGSGVIIGPNCKLFNGVTLGNKDTESSVIAQPVLEEGVIVGTGAKLLGPIRVGAYAKIGANSVVVKDIPAGEVWAGVPARRIRSDCSN